MSVLISCCFHALVDHFSCPIFPFTFSPISDCWNFYHIKETIVTPFSNLRPNSFASTIVSQSEISTDKANPESKLVFTWENIITLMQNWPKNMWIDPKGDRALRLSEGKTDRYAYLCTYGQISPVFYSTLSPLGPLPKRHGLRSGRIYIWLRGDTRKISWNVML